MAQKFHLESPFLPAGDQPQAIEALYQGILQGFFRQILLGVTGSGKTFTLAHVIAKLNRPTLVMAPNKTLAAQLYAEMRELFPKNAVEYFVSYYDYYQPEAYVPASDTFIEKDAAINEQIEQMRLSATKALFERRDVIIVATVSAIYGLGDPTLYLKMLLHIRKGDIIDRNAILKRLSEIQYTRNDIEFARGHYRVRGDTIDIFPADSDKEAIRVGLFDDEVESIQSFDPLTGIVTQDMPRVTIYPKTHYVTPREEVLRAVDVIAAELTEQVAYFREHNKLIEAQRINERTRFDLEMLMELGYCNGIENYSRHLSSRQAGDPPSTLFDYFPKDGLLVLDESHVLIGQLNGMYRGDRARKENLVQYGFRLPSAMDNRPLNFAEFEARSMQTIFVSATPGEYEYAHADAIAEQVVRPTGLIDPVVEIRPASTQVADVLGEINKRIPDQRVLITTLTKKMAEDLTQFLTKQNIKVRYLHSDVDTVERVELIRDLRKGVFDVLVGINLLREGLDMPEVALVAILDADKEGFLRSKRSLIQTIGRAARHLEGKAILYADKMTPAMEEAINETNRRREKQIQFNIDHNIIPRGIVKPIKDILEVNEAAQKAKLALPELPKNEKARLKYLKKLEEKMYTHARNLEFEAAAQVRDLLDTLKHSG